MAWECLRSTCLILENYILLVTHECIWILGLVIQAWLLGYLFMFSVHLKPKHLESLFITDLYEVQAGDVLGLKALSAESQSHQDLASCVGNGWICQPLLFSRQMLATSVCWLVAQTNQTNLQQPGRRLPGPRAVCAAAPVAFAASSGPVPLLLLGGVARAGAAYRCGGVQLSGCVLTECLHPGLFHYTRSTGRVLTPPGTASTQYFQCELPLCLSLA